MNDLNYFQTLAAQLFAAGLYLTAANSALAAVRYVDVNSANPTAPYTNWDTAATNIQDAVDASIAGDEILVTNGIYATGGRAIDGTMTNRVAVDKALTLRSVNGPQFTFIQGRQVPGTINGDDAIRCVYLADGASLLGFTLTNGATRAVDDSPTNRESSGGGLWCASTNGVVSNCVMSGNSAFAFGGAAYGGSVDNCVLRGNSGNDVGGGGASACTLNNCTLAGNSGAGARGCILNNCALTGNSGAGSWGCTLNNCTLTGNSGGGAAYSTLNNCIAYFNASSPTWSTLNTLNQGPNYDAWSSLNYCCTTPLPPIGMGVGNISVDPQLASASHLSAASPCRGAGNAAYRIGTDIDGEGWADPPSVGCDEYHAGASMGPMIVGITATFTNVAMGFSAALTGLIEGQTAKSTWDFGDGTTVTNQTYQPYTSHVWATPGDYAVVLRAYNESQPSGVSATINVHVVTRPIHYVAGDSSNPAAPYMSWETAATNIQDAVDAATVPGSLLQVTNGVYTTGGRDGNRVRVDKPLDLRSINGPQFTIIDGGRSVRCLYLANSATLSGFTLTNGFGQTGPPSWDRTPVGGGLWCQSSSAVVSNSVLVGNGVYGHGGGAFGGTLINCVLAGNSADFYGSGEVDFPGVGGGAFGCVLNNCNVVGNSAHGFNFNAGAAGRGGGVSGCTLNNCTVTGNTTSGGRDPTPVSGSGASGCSLNNCIVYLNRYYDVLDNYDGCELNYCCTVPQPPNGFGNITSAPLFVDFAGGNLRMQSNSPCINAGNNSYVTTATDLDGNPRIAGGTVDIGAYEFPSPTSIISFAWLQQYNLPTDGSADTADPDGDGLNSWQEWRCGTDPTNALSVLRLLAPVTEATNAVVSWQSVAGVNYFLERATNLATPRTFTPLAAAIPGHPGTTTYTDTNATGAGLWFYRVGVSTP